MKLITYLLLILPLIPLGRAETMAGNVKTVYILRMSNGLDQYLAGELNKGNVYLVTTDPAKADAVFTESLGETFEKRFADLFIPPPPKPVLDTKDKKDADQGLKGEDVKRSPSSWSRGRGAIFLVDRQSRNVLWSMNRQPKDTSSRTTLDHAVRIVKQLKIDLGLVVKKTGN